MSQNSTWDSIKSLFSPKTIPFLISQGVVPKLFPVGTLLIGLVLGFIWAYFLSPTVYTGAAPVNLSDSQKQEYVKQVAWQFRASGDGEEARRQLRRLGDAPRIIDQMQLSNTDSTLTDLLNGVKPFAETNQEELNKITPGFFNSNLTPLLCIIGAAIGLGLPVIVNTIIPITLLFQRRSKEKPTVAAGQEAIRQKTLKEAQEKAKQFTAPTAAVNLGTPVTRHMTTYIMGDDLYDDSFSIETASGDFLGEMGGGISKTLGVGDQKKVTAVEVWVFDKNDIKTVTKVLMSEHAFNDEGIRAELAPKGEAVQAKAGEIVLLETQTLIIQASIIDLAYGTGPLPPNSFFERISVELSAYPKKGAAAGAGAGGGAFGDTAEIG